MCRAVKSSRHQPENHSAVAKCIAAIGGCAVKVARCITDQYPLRPRTVATPSEGVQYRLLAAWVYLEYRTAAESITSATTSEKRGAVEIARCIPNDTGGGICTVFFPAEAMDSRFLSCSGVQLEDRPVTRWAVVQGSAVEVAQLISD